jgi:flagellar biosynthesis GTPase FlhF
LYYQAIAISNADIRASRRSVRRFNQSSKNTTSNSIDNVLETPINVSMTTDNNATIIGTLPQFIRTKSTNKLSSSIANSNHHQQQQSIDTNQIDQSTTKQSFHRGTQLRTSIARIRKTIRSATSARNVISSDDNVMINSVSTHRRDEYKIVLVGAAGVGKTSLV